MVQGAPPNSWIQLESITRPILLDFLQGKNTKQQSRAAKNSPIFQVSALQELPGRHKQLQKPLEAASAQQLQLDSSSDGVQSYRKNGGVSSASAILLEFCRDFSWDKTNKNGGSTIKNWD